MRHRSSISTLPYDHHQILTSSAILLFFVPFSSSILFICAAASPGGRELDLCLKLFLYKKTIIIIALFNHNHFARNVIWAVNIINFLLTSLPASHQHWHLHLFCPSSPNHYLSSLLLLGMPQNTNLEVFLIILKSIFRIRILGHPQTHHQ